jgi:hypothetical protein
MSAQFRDNAVSTSSIALTIRADPNSERKQEMMLKNKVAVIYGSGGDIGVPSFFSPGANWQRSNRLPRTSLPPGGLRRRQRSTL